MPEITIIDDRFRPTFHTSLNGRDYHLPIKRLLSVEDLLVDHLKAVGCDFIEGPWPPPVGGGEGEEGSAASLPPIEIPATIEEDTYASDMAVHDELEAREEGEQVTDPVPPVEPEPEPEPDPEPAPEQHKAKLGLGKKKK